MTVIQFNALSFKLVALATNATEQTISNRIAKLLENSEVVSIQLVENQEGQKEAVLQVKTSLTFSEARKRLQKSRINGRPCRVQRIDADSEDLTVNDHFENRESSPNGKSRKTKENRPKQGADSPETKQARELEKAEVWNHAKEIASCFHLHVNADDELLERVSDREEMSIVFQSFLADMSSSEQTERERFELEKAVMTHLRQQRLLRSKRLGDQVLMTLARLGGPGDFPSLETLQQERQRFLENVSQTESNKKGVEVNVVPFDDKPIAVREERKIWIKITSSDPTVQLIEVNIRGGARATKAFSIIKKEKIPFVIGSEEQVVGLSFLPYHAVVYRCQVRCVFRKSDDDSFEIVRYLRVPCGDLDKGGKLDTED
jgi:hypothetical protein